MNPYALHHARIEMLCRWITAATTAQSAVGRYESARESAAETAGDIRRLRIARRAAILAITDRKIRIAGGDR